MSAGIYVHVPFCLTRCGYCDFNAHAGLGHLAQRYARALRAEVDLGVTSLDQTSSRFRAGERFGSVFLGGGTPTTIDPHELAGVLLHLRELLDVAPGAEVTTEANPDTVDEAGLESLLAGGFTRLSMGVQSFDPSVLEALERVHTPASARRAYTAARSAGWSNVNLDLIYGANGETLGSWRHTLEETIALGPEHVSAYALTIESATPLGRKVASGLSPAPDPDLQAEMFTLACELLGAAGYVHYEVSNWARPGLECRHNLVYWRREPYLGLGAGAHSFCGERRWWNLRPPLAYLEAVESGVDPIGGHELLGADERRLEDVSLRLRTREGIAGRELDPDAVDPLVDAGLLERLEGRVIATEAGMLLLNQLVVELTDEQALAAADC